MKVRYTFDVSGEFRLTIARTLIIEDATVTVELSPENVLRKLIVTFPLGPGEKLPSITPSTEAGVKMNFDIPSYKSIDHAIELARNLEDQLCVFGLDTVDTDSYVVEWIAETEDEKRQLLISQFRASQGVPDEFYALWRPSMLKAALLSRHRDETFRIQLSFFRAGWRETKQLRCAGAFMYFFFFIESLYGDNEVKTRQLVAAFCASTELSDATREALTTQSKKSPYASLSVAEAFQRMVDRRGFLFHNQAVRKREWAEPIHTEFAIDADLLRQVSSRIAIARLWPAGTVPPRATVHDDAYRMLGEHLEANRRGISAGEGV